MPIKSDSEHYPPDAKLRVYRSRSGGNEWEPLTRGLPQQDCYVNVLRDAMTSDSLDPCGIYFGTTGGQVYASADAGDTWNPIVRDLPAVLSVKAQVIYCVCTWPCLESGRKRPEKCAQHPARSQEHGKHDEAKMAKVGCCDGCSNSFLAK